METSQPREIGLVSCVKSKREEAAVPKELYVSDYFEKMRSYAEREHDEWWILSAEHGLLDPEGEPIDPYEKTLKNAGVAERRAWADDIVDDMVSEGFIDESVKIVVHAGKDYYEQLVPKLEAVEHVEVVIPTKGLAFGETLSWYKARV